MRAIISGDKTEKKEEGRGEERSKDALRSLQTFLKWATGKERNCKRQTKTKSAMHHTSFYASATGQTSTISALSLPMKNGKFLCECWLHSTCFYGKWSMKTIVKKPWCLQRKAILCLPCTSLPGLTLSVGPKRFQIRCPQISLRLTFRQKPTLLSPLVFPSVQLKKNLPKVYNPVIQSTPRETSVGRRVAEISSLKHMEGSVDKH